MSDGFRRVVRALRKQAECEGLYRIKPWHWQISVPGDGEPTHLYYRHPFGTATASNHPSCGGGFWSCQMPGGDDMGEADSLEDAKAKAFA